MDQKAPKQRISRLMAGFLIAIALIFDILQLGTKILHLLGGFVIALGVALAPFTFGASSAMGGGAAAVIWILEIALSLAIAIIGYFTIGLILMLRGVSPIGGKHAVGDMAWLFGTMVLEIVPFLNALPGLSLWTVRKIVHTRSEDEEKIASHKKFIQQMNTADSRFAQMPRPAIVHA